MVMQPETPEAEPTTPLEQMLFEIKKVIVGQEALLERILVALLARGHILVEGVPGLAKTLAIRTVAQVVGGEFNRIQFTPDLVPADLVGTRIYNQKTGDFSDVPRPRVHQPAAGGRDQPRAREGAVGPPRGHAGAPGDDRPRDAQGAGALPRPGDPEPDRDRGHLRAARGAGRPLHDEGPRRLPDRPRRAGRRPAHDQRPADAAPDHVDRRSSWRCRSRPTPSTSTRS